ncbi:hypothetical protein L7F22_022765 [Adiantum nelumboides]|nr:hypothetical protein [Adiantum nelumboides]
MRVGGHGCERVPESMFYAYGGAETRWQEVNSKLRSPLPQNLIDENLARAIQEESLTKEACDAKKRAREELQKVHEESYSTQAPTPIANVSGGQEGGCSSTPGASSHMGESRSAPPIVSSSQIHANVSKKSKQHVAPHLQTTLASRFAPKLKKEVEIAEQQFFYQCNLAFRIARSPAYHRFYNTLVSADAAAAGATGLRCVNAEALRTTHLKSQVAHIKKELEGLQACWQRYGCSIISDGWSDIDDLVQLWNERFDWFHKPIHIVAYMLHPLYKKLSHWNDRKLIEAWTRYIETVYATDDCSLIEEESILFSQDRDYFARPIALKEESKQQAVSWWEINGRLTPTLQRLALRTLSQECTSGAAEHIWSICADIHTRKRNRLSTSQLDKLVYVNANLRLLERLRLRDGNGEGVLQWKVKDIDASVIANLERGLARGEAIDITFIQQRSDEDLAYDFLREEQTRFRRVTRAQARALQLPTEPPTMDAGVGPSTRGRSTLARGGRRGRGGRATRSSLVMREMMPSDESASSSSSTHSEMDAASDSDFVSE